MSIQSVYEQLPYWVQNLAISVRGGVIVRRRFNKDFHEELGRLERHEYDPAEELVRLLEVAKDMKVYQLYLDNVDWGKLSEKPQGVYDVVSRFPIIGKLEVKADTNSFTNQQYEGAKIIGQTSGTTGGGLIFPYPVEMENKQWAVWWRYRRALGIQLDTWCGWFGGKRIINPDNKKRPYWRINKPGRQVMYSSYHLTKETARDYYEDIKKRGLAWIHGYPSHIARLASLIIDAGLEPLAQLKWVTTGAENLVGNQLMLMEKAFPNALIRQHYGLGEGVANISQDREGNWKVDEDFCYVEFIPVDESNPGLCRIIGTGLWNKAFPLIRYDTGDLATVEWNEEGSLKRVVKIDGRTGNTIRQPSGHEITEAALSIVLHDYSNIVEAQFHQKSLDNVELWVVKGKNYGDDDETQLMKALKGTFDSGINITLKYVDNVERTNAGKLRIVITE